MRIPINVNGQTVVINAQTREQFVNTIIQNVSTGMYPGSDLEQMTISELREFAGEQWDQAIEEAREAAMAETQTHSQSDDYDVNVRIDTRIGGAKKASTGG